MEVYKNKMKRKVDEARLSHEKSQGKYTNLISVIVVGVASTIFIAVSIYQIFVK